MKRHLLMGLAMVTILGYFYFNFIGTLSQNVVPISKQEKKLITSFFPQGWGFFTRNPREPKYLLYKITGDAPPQLMNYKITSYKNLFGLSRRGNRICMEMIRIQHQLPQSSEWIDSKLDVNEFEYSNCSFDTINYDQGELFYVHPGRYLIKEYQITPWNWLKYPDNYSGEFKYYAFQLKKL